MIQTLKNSRAIRAVSARSSTYVSVLLAVLVGAVVCGCKEKKPETAAPTTATPVPAAAEPSKATAYEPSHKTTFTEVTSQLDPGGTLFAYLSTEQWLAGLGTNVAKFGELIKNVPDIPEEDREQVDKVVSALTKAVHNSGIEQLTGVGISSVEVAPELHRSKLIVHHRKGEGNGLLWNVMGREAHALEAMKMLPQTTALAGFGDVDLTAVWKAIEGMVADAQIPQAVGALEAFQNGFESGTGLSWTNVLASLGGEAGMILTLDESRKVSLPVGSEPLEFPEPGLVFALKVKNDTIYDHLSQKLQENPATVVTNEPGLKMCAMPIPVPLPVQVQITLASTGDYLFAATSPELVRTVLAVRRGTAPGLTQSAEFKALTQHLPATGNQFFYTGKSFSETVLNVQTQVMKAQGNSAPQAAFFQEWFQGKGASYGLAIGGHTPTGWETVTVGNKDYSGAMLAMPVAAGVAVPAAMLLPALAKAKSRAQNISCANNMKQIVLAFKIWSTDHEDQFPFNVSADKGGSLEACELGDDGFDVNAYKHFQVLSNELVTVKVLVCPGDDSKTAAESFQELSAQNVSYKLRTGKDVKDSNPEEVLIYCPIHGNEGLCDGSVRQGSR